MNKICKHCKEEKNIEQFYHRRDYADGYDNTCKECRLSNMGKAYRLKKQANDYFQVGKYKYRKPKKSMFDPPPIIPLPRYIYSSTGMLAILTLPDEVKYSVSK